ncbi:hypothetical protein DSN97_00100 [Deferribacteraceae bacterium V6Fe1]|nr:hypothetical protein DSN97_00100 [Deferribacteraceae bacterium V6Fe1]
MNIDELVRIHDRSQFEIKLGYLINPDAKKTEYDISLYLFIPKNLGIDENTYPKDKFYGNMYSYLRLITPKDNLRNITNRVINITEILKKKNSNIDIIFNHINYEVKISACAFRSYLRDYTKAFKKGGGADKSIDSFVEDVAYFRAAVKEMASYAEVIDNKKLSELLLFTDEYTSFVVSIYLVRIFDILSKNMDKACEKVSTILTKEVEYRRLKGMSYVTKDELNNEFLLYKYSVYKKYFYNILFLKLKKKSGSTELRHFAYAIAAGISMIFATGAAFVAQYKYGNFTTSFFIALVISYMFKDRIKDFFRSVFDRTFISKRVYDFKNKIYNIERLKLFGFYKERVVFVKDGELPNEVINKRLQNTSSSLSTWFLGENVLKYERKVKLNNNIIKSAFKDRIEGLNDIMRFDIEDFTRKMDDPKSNLYFVEGCNVKKVDASKVYHINLVGEFKTFDRHFLFKVRIVMTKKGIKRIEIPLSEDNVIVKKSD